ncbi:MAG: type II secretory pathway component PulF [Lentimonas sp.]|jgi:type II secretory pathway component PulF
MASHKLLSNWYLQLAEHLESGTPLAEAITVCSGPCDKDRFRLSALIESGTPIEEVMKTAPAWLPKTDRVFMSTAMETGRLPQTLRNLSDRHQRIGATQLKVILGILYPLGVYHIAALVLPIVRMIDYETGFTWDASKHLLQSSLLLGPLWALIALILFLVKTNNPMLARILRGIPLLRRYSKAQALADFAYALGTFIDAGVPMDIAWGGSARIAHDPAITRAYRAMEPTFAAGADPVTQLKAHKVFPPDFVSFYAAGTQSGKLDQMMLKSGQQYQTQANHAMTYASIVYPTLLFACVAAVIVFTIFQVYGGYLDLLSDLAE